MAVLGRIDFRTKRKTVTVHVPELGGDVILRSLSVRQLEMLTGSAQAPTNGAAGANGSPAAVIAQTDSTARQLLLAIVDEEGNQLYDDTPENLDNIREMSVDIFKTLMDALNKLHGVTEEQLAEAKKKSESMATTGSGSSSPGTSVVH